MILHTTPLSQCPECQKRFSRMASLKAHITQHFEDETQTCHLCNDEFETVKALQHHVDEEHKMTVARKSAVVSVVTTPHQSFACKQCQAVLDSHTELKKHSRIHQKVNSILLCKKKKAVATSNSNKARFTCSHCSMTFDKPSLCARHERVHTGERPYKCDQCDRGFSQKNSLVSHQKAIHGREKPFRCTLCPYASSQRGLLFSLTLIHFVSLFNVFICLINRQLESSREATSSADRTDW
jgi:uncharacterized Zn-finger protein